MKKLVRNFLAVFAFCLLAFPVAATDYYVSTSGSDVNDGLSSGSPKLTIQAAINAASHGDKINVAAGTYTISSTIYVNKELTIEGASMATVILDASGTSNASWRVIETDGNNITLKNFTVKPIANTDGGTTKNGFTIKAGSNSAPTVDENLTLENITIDGAAERTPFDVHGIDGVTLKNLFASGTTSGNGINITGCTDVLIDGFTGIANAWGSIAIYASRHVPSGGRGSDDVEIIGSSLSIDGAVYAQDDFGSPDLYNTDVSVTGWEFRVFNDDFKAEGPEFTYYADEEADANLIGAGLNSAGPNTASVIEHISTGNWYVTSDDLSIQTAIDEATSGDKIIVRAGTYEEGLTIGKTLDLIGPNELISPNTGSRVGEAIINPTGGSGAPDALTGSASSITVNFKGFLIDMFDTRYDTYYSKRYLTQTTKTGTTWNLEHNIFQNAQYAVNGDMYISGNPSLIFNLHDNLFRITETQNYISNGIAIWGSHISTIDVRDNVWDSHGYTAMNINNCHGSIEDNTFKEMRDLSSFDRDDDWYVYQSGILMAGASFDLDIMNNSFEDCTYGLIFYGNVDGDIDVQQNTFDGTLISSIRASSSQFDPGTDLDDVVITDNNFINFAGTVGVDFQIAIARTDGQIIHASCNWWGTNDHDDIKDLVHDDADVVPYQLTDGGTCACNLEIPIRAHYRPSKFKVGSEWYNISTNGGSDGFIKVKLKIGTSTPPYTYSWTGPLPMSGSGTYIYGLKAGSYYLEVTDDEGCKGNAGPWTLREPAP